MVRMRVLVPLLCVATLSFAQGERELTAYSLLEIESYVKVFLDTYNDRKQPEDDATACLEDIEKAYRYLDSKGEDRTKEEIKAQNRMVDVVAKGLKARKRPLVTLECANVLGKMGSKRGAKPLQQWMERTVLDLKSPNPQWVEYGFNAMAAIGSEDRATMDLLLDYAKGKHLDTGVASHAIAAVGNWKHLKAKSRKEFYDKINMYLNGLWSGFHSGDKKKWASYEKKYDGVKVEGLKTLALLADQEKPFEDPPKAQAWWRENKRAKWVDYVPPQYRTKKP